MSNNRYENWYAMSKHMLKCFWNSVKHTTDLEKQIEEKEKKLLAAIAALETLTDEYLYKADYDCAWEAALEAIENARSE